MASCRGCGGDTQPITICSMCEEDIQWRCLSCSKESDTLIHSHGGYVSETVDITVDAVKTPTFATAA